MTLIGVALLISGTALLIFDVVLDRTSGIIAGSTALFVTAVLWLVLPYGARPQNTWDEN